MAAELVHSIECSVQPLDFSFHKSRDIVAAALVDGTVELHDFSARCKKVKAATPGVSSDSLSAKKDSDEDDGDDDNDNEDGKDEEDSDEFDTIMSSIPVHSNEVPIRMSSNNKNNDFNAKNTGVPSPSASDAAGMSSSCRSVLISSLGDNIFTAGNGGGICCLDFERACDLTATVKSCQNWRMDGASPYGIHRLYQLPSNDDNNNNNTSSLGPSIIVSGDDEGTIRLWDIRMCGNYSTPATSTTSVGGKKKGRSDGSMKTTSSSNNDSSIMPRPKGCIMSFSNNRDYISEFDMYGNTLLATSADGTLSAYDLSKPGQLSGHKNSIISKSSSVIKQSDEQEDELTSVVVMKNGRKVVCGSQMGVLNVWSFGTWGDVSDRFPGHPQSIDSLLKVDEDTLLTGCSDGFIRAVQIHPDKLLGVIGGDHGGFPVEALRFSPNRKLLGSISHDVILRLWDASVLNDDDGDDDDDDEDDDDINNGVMQISAAAATITENTNNSEDDWEDAITTDDEEEDDDDDDDDDSSSDGRNKKKTRTFPTENEQFFSDL